MEYKSYYDLQNALSRYSLFSSVLTNLTELNANGNSNLTNLNSLINLT